MRRTPALIVGGGPAGSAAAIMLARGGIAPELIERTHEPHDVVCGGFLGWDALAALRNLGIDAAGLGARPIHRLRLISKDRAVETVLPKAAVGLSRRTLDEALLNAAGAGGATLLRGRSVRAASAERVVRLDDGEEIGAEALFLATGKHELRGLARPPNPRSEVSSIGLRATLPASPALDRALAGMIELHLFDGGYAGLLLQEDGSANVALSASRTRLSAAGSSAALLAEVAAEVPRLGDRIGALGADVWIAIAGVPYGWRTSHTTPGIFRLGDQSAVISSLAGDGVAIALTSGIAAAEAMLRHGPAGAEIYQRRFSRQAALPLAIADALRHAGERKRPRAALMRLATSPGLTRLAARLTRIG